MIYVLLKLKNEKEVIGKISENHHHINPDSLSSLPVLELNDVLVLNTFHGVNGVPTVKLEKYCLFAKERNIDFLQQEIKHVFTPTEDFIEYYETNLKSFDQKEQEEENEEYIETSKGPMSKSDMISLLETINPNTETKQ